MCRAAAGKELNLAEDVFKLQHLLDCNILAHREEIEEITSAAVKEEQIEVKLAGIESDWAAMNLSFADYKTRGPVILKSSDTAELIEKLEDSQMSLGSMATNRCVMGCHLMLLWHACVTTQYDSWCANFVRTWAVPGMHAVVCRSEWASRELYHHLVLAMPSCLRQEAVACTLLTQLPAA